MTNDDLFKQYLGKHIFVKLKSGRNYSGELKEVSNVGNGFVFISIIDKFKQLVTFTSGEIEVLEEFKERC